MAKVINKLTENQKRYIDRVHKKDVDLEKKAEMERAIKRNIEKVTKESQ